MNIQQLIFGLVWAAVAMYAFTQQNRDEATLQAEGIPPGKSTSLYPLLLPITFIIFSALFLAMGSNRSLSKLLANCWQLFVYISVYYGLLLMLLPLLRRKISARACAALWLVPTFLFFKVYHSGYEATPIFTITMPLQWLYICSWIWVAGFAAALLWQILSHFGYRRFLLQNVVKVVDDDIISLWYKASIMHGIQEPFPVFMSQHTHTPLTIGCFQRTMVLVLPKQSYTQQELSLIFRHELRHILRRDTQAKMFIGVYWAVCWFNPLSWLARKKVADDLELSCDEAVLSDADDATRRLYAELLLKTAGSSRGYTTCLSAAASSLRYRLRSIVKPIKRASGGIVVGAALFAFIMVYGTVAFTGSPGTVQTLIFESASPGTAITGLHYNSRFYPSVYAWDESALTQYLASLGVTQIYSGNYGDDAIPSLYIEYGQIIDGEAVNQTSLGLCDTLLVVSHAYGSSETLFRLEDPLDWRYLNGLLH